MKALEKTNTGLLSPNVPAQPKVAFRVAFASNTRVPIVWPESKRPLTSRQGWLVGR
jgi:hypothetical protein